MTPGVRRGVFVASAAGFGAFLLAGMLQLPAFGQHATIYATTITAVAPAERHAANLPSAINFDYRGFDTLGEEFILFTAVIGIAQLLSHLRPPTKRPAIGPLTEVPPPSDAVRLLSLAAFALTLIVGVNTILHGHLTPGSGFQGGVVASAAWMLIYLGFGAHHYARFTRHIATEAVESAGGAAYVLVGCLGVAAGSVFLANVLPLGRFNTLLSAGTIPVIDIAAGIEVAAAFMVIYRHFIDCAHDPRDAGAG